MKLKSVPLQIESYVNHLQYELAQGAKKMTSRLNMTSKDFDFLADTFKKMYRSAVATEVPGVMWAEKLLVEEIKSRCHHFNEALWNVAVGFEDIRNTYEVPEQNSHSELDHEDQ
jgi:hypothetical protein